MESGEGQIIRIQICEKCYEHQSYDCHSEQQYHEAFQKFSSNLKQADFVILRNVAPKYLKKAPNNKNSTKRYIDTNTGKIVQFPGKGTFQVYYRNILIYSKLQVSAFPDISYLCLIIKKLKDMYYSNPCILSSLEKFRNIQFQWKRNQVPNESLYTFIKMNSLGNTQQTFIKDILRKLMVEGPQQQGQRNKKKIVHPYSIYQNTEKKQKMQSIYCPKPIIPQYLTQRRGNGLFSTRNFKKKQLRPQTSEISTRKTKENCDYAWTQRQSGIIVKNTQKNHIFQLVLKEQNKQLNKQKIQKILKNQNLTIIPKFKPSKSNNKNFRFQSNTKQNQTQEQKKFQKSKNKQVYITHLQNIQHKQIRKNGNVATLNFKSDVQKKNNNQILLNQNKSSITDRLKNKKGQFMENQIQLKNSQQNIQNLSSSRFGSIKKNIIQSNFQDEQMEENQKSFQSIEQSERMMRNVIGQQKHLKKNNKRKYKQSECQDYQASQSQRRSQDREARGSRIVKNNSRCIKQSKYSKVRQEVKRCKSMSDQEDNNYQNKESKRYNKSSQTDRNRPQISNRIKQDNQNSQNSINSNKSNTQSQLSQNQVTQSRLKRASIEQTTVQKRIRQRKRSSNHQRYPNNLSRLSKLNSLQIQIENSHRQNLSNFVDQINDIQNSTEMNQNFIPIEKDWQDFAAEQVYVREPAQIIKKFAQESSFLSINSYENSYSQILHDSQRPQVKFQIKGQQLLKTFVIKSIRQIHRPSQVRLFPEIFKQIQFNAGTQFQNLASSAGSSLFTHNSNFSNNNCHYYKSKLVHVVNLMLRSNPMMISRIFEDKKSINPYGVYCMWLRNISGRFQPVFVNDQFAFEVVTLDKKPDEYRAIYSWLGNENSIWFMLLEKAVAKILGGYQAINQTNLAQLMNIIMGSPTVDIGYINPQKALKVFDEKIFYNKMASLYTLRQNISTETGCTSIKQGSRVDRIIGFSYSKRNPSDSAVNIKVEEATVTMSMRQFLLNYGEVALLFFNNNYFLNQIQLTPTSNELSVISCRLICANSKNNCYLMFSCFPQKHNTKVTLYRQLNDDQAHIRQGMNPLSQQNRRYEYVGQICKTGSFFFEAQLNGGQYICLMQSIFKESKPFMSIFSQYPIQVKQANCNQLGDKNKKSSIKKMKSKRKQNNEQDSFSYSQYDRSKTPKILIEQKINANDKPKFYDEKMYKKYQQKVRKQQNQMGNNDQLEIRVNKQYAYQLDNIMDSDEEKDKNQHDKQNMSRVSRTSGSSNVRSSRNKKIIVVEIQPKKQKHSRNSSLAMKQSLYQNGMTNAIQEVQQQRQADLNYDDERDMSPTPIVNKNRIIDDYD